MIELILGISVLTNIVFWLYCRFLIRNLNRLVESVKDMSVMFSGFKDHVEMLHETEMFYGDASLQSLIEHSKFVLDEIENNAEIIDMFELPEEESYATEEKEEE
tara:strand:- start:28587 stop:28898 length:312 start_codon:yes stop_codon:yes gene_type:complete